MEENLKQKLLDTTIFIDNEFFNKYVQLVIDNKQTQFIKYKTNVHHIIPKYYYIEIDQPIDDSALNTVNLLYKDHILAHYYLAMCSNNCSHIAKNSLSIRFLLQGVSLKDLNIDDIDLDQYQQMYESSKIWQSDISHSYASNLCISNKLKGRISPNKGNIKPINEKVEHNDCIKNVKLSELAKQRVGVKNSFYGKKHSQSVKQKISNANSIPVAMLDRHTGVVLKQFTSMTAASKYLVSNQIATSMSSAKAISAVCNGKAKHAYGFKWVFIDKV